MVTITRQEQVDNEVWEFEWTSTLENPTYYIYREGVLLMATGLEAMSFVVGPGEYAQIEILDDPDAVPGRSYPGRLLLGWQGLTEAAGYRVEEYVDGAWVVQKRVAEMGRSYYTYRTRWLQDGESYQWRVVSEQPAGVDGGVMDISVLVVRRPDRAALGYSYDEETGKVTFLA